MPSFSTMTFPKPTTDALTNLQTTFNYGQNYKRINQSNMEKFNRLNTPQYAAYMVPKGATVSPFTIDVTGSYDTNYSLYTSGEYAGDGGSLLFHTVGQSADITIYNLPSGTSINVLCLGGGGGGGGGGDDSSCGIGGGGGGLYLSTITVSGTYNITVGNGGLGGTGNSGGIGGNGDNGGSSKVIGGNNYNVTAEGGTGGGGGKNNYGGEGGNYNDNGKITSGAGGNGGTVTTGGNAITPYNQQFYNSTYQLRCGGGGGKGSSSTAQYYAGNWNNYTPAGNNNWGAGGNYNARGGIGNIFSISSPPPSEGSFPYSIFAGGGGGGASYGEYPGGNGAQGFVLLYW